MNNLELLGFVVDCLSTLLAATAILIYIHFWIKDKRINSYNVFDSLYQDILKTGLEYPQFRNPEKTKDYKNSFSENQLIQYEIYAYMCWNFCETIYDKKDKRLMRTWLVVLEEERNLHLQWINQPENERKFKPEFLLYIKQAVQE
jgi:hypothetical protein